MKRRATLSLACLLAGSAPVLAQDSSVPTRVRAEHYGAASGLPLPNLVEVGVAVTESEGTSIRVWGGLAGNFAALLIGSQQAKIDLPRTAVLLVAPEIPVFGWFDEHDRFSLPIDLGERAFIGMPLFVQGLHYGPMHPHYLGTALQLSKGMKIDVVAGNKQPADVTYEGPSLESILVRENGDPADAYRDQVLTSIEVPTSGYDFVYDMWETSDGVTRLHLTIVAPGPDEITNDMPETKRIVAGLGPGTASKVEVVVAQVTRGRPSLPVYELAALIDRDFGPPGAVVTPGQAR